MTRLVVRKAAIEGIKGVHVVKSMTNEKYDALAKIADQKIEQANREYAAAYKKASLYSAK